MSSGNKKPNMNKIWGTYKDLLEQWEGSLGLKRREEVQNWVSDWFQYFQLNEVFRKGKENGFLEGSSEFKKGILESNPKLISKL